MPDPIFVISSPRSGSTLLRVMLAGHPGLFAPPEMVIAPFATMRERRAKLEQRFWEKGGLRRAIMDLEGVDVDQAKAIEASLDELTVPEVYEWLQKRLGNRILVDKCPHLAPEPASLARLAQWFPNARWIWIVRHPGSVVRSVENMPMAEVMLSGYSQGFGEIWHDTNRSIQNFLADIPAERWARVHYEPLVTDPRKTMLELCDKIGIAFCEELLTPYDGDRMREGPTGARAVGDPNMATRGRIQPELATSWLEGFDPQSVSAATHSLARQLGYDLAGIAPPPISQVSQALAELWDSARKIEASMRMPADLDNVEGRRFLLRMLSAGVDLFVEEGDVDRPQFHHAEGPTRKMFADNPDTDYWRASIRLGEGRRYRITGRVAKNSTYVGVLLYRKGGVCGARLHDEQFVDQEGRFDMVVSAEPDALLRGQGDEVAVMVRQYFHDRQKELPVELSIELLDAPPPVQLEPRSFAARLGRAKRNLEAVFDRTLRTWKMASTKLINRFQVLEGEELFPTPDNTYVVCWYRLGHDQLMLVRGKVPKARYWGFCLYNVWMESLEYRHHTIFLNAKSLKTNPDGTYEICIAHRDVGHPNWLDTTGHLAGYALIRVLLGDEAMEAPTTRILYEHEWQATH